jgi:hypothetical protein
MQSPSPIPAVPVIRRPAVARGLPAAAVLLLTIALAACSSSSSPSAGPTGAAGSSNSSPASSSAAAPSSGHTRTTAKGKAIPGLISFKGAFRLTGAKRQHSSFTAFPGVTSPASSCARLAARGTPVPSGQKPQFRLPGPAAGSPVYFLAEVSPYHGPGTYSKASIITIGSNFVVGSASYNPLAASATASVTFRANGSGAFTFHNAKAAKPATGTLSGSVSWTCSG